MADDADAPGGTLTGSAPATPDGGADEPRELVAEPPARPRSFVPRSGLVFGVVVIVALSALAGWLGVCLHREQLADQNRALFLQTARQGALDLTTIGYTEVETDMQRILDISTGSLNADFQKRAQPFIDVVKRTKAKSVGTITGAALESVDGDQAHALVSVRVTTTNNGAKQEIPRAWRMRLDVRKVGDEAKVAKVEFLS